MTPITELSPEELRVEIAEAMGWTLRSIEDAPFTTPYWHNPYGCVKDPLPNYPADANAALTLATKLAEKWDCEISSAVKVDEWTCYFTHKNNTAAFQESATGPNAFPLALCRAFLAVVRSERKGTI